MTFRPLAWAIALAASLALPTALTAQDFKNEIAARKGLMANMALNLGVLGGMARGNIDYDADAASTAAANLAAIGTMNIQAYWPEGSDSMMLDTTRALPAIWDDPADVGKEWMAYSTAATALAGVAGDGLDAMRAGLGGVGKTCGSCHEKYQEPDS